MRAILGLVSIDGGSITWDGGPITQRGSPSVRVHAGRARPVPEDEGARPRRVLRPTVGARAARGRGRGRSVARAGGRLTDRADDEVQDLSSGNQQRVQLALALVERPGAAGARRAVLRARPGGGRRTEGRPPRAGRRAARRCCSAATSSTSSRTSAATSSSSTTAASCWPVTSAQLRRDAEHSLRRGHLRRPERLAAAVRHARRRSSDGTQVRLRVPADVDPGVVLADAQLAGGSPPSPSRPPELSEVFLSAVGRPSLEAEPERRGRVGEPAGAVRLVAGGRSSSASGRGPSSCSRCSSSWPSSASA